LLEVLEYNQDTNEIIELPINEMNFHRVKWLNCVNPTKDELDLINKFTGISYDDLERGLDEDERPGIAELENFSMVVFTSPFKKKKEIIAVSFSMMISQNLFITIQKKEVQGVKKVLDYSSLSKQFSKGTSYLLYHVLERVMDNYFEVLDNVEKDINIIEQNVFHSPSKKDAMQIFNLKKTLIYFHKSLAANREVLLNINDDLSTNVDVSLSKKFRYIYEDIVQIIDMVATYRDILTSTLDIYLTNVSNNLNNIMKKMTAFATIILVPTMITGLYGMNFKHMPEIAWQYGYLFAWILIIAWMIGLWIYFKKKDWI